MSALSVVTVNIGGEIYDTTRATLAKGGGKFESYFQNDANDSTVVLDKEMRPFVDAKGTLFLHILSFLRRDALPDSICNDAGVLKDLRREAEFFGLESMQQSIQARLRQLGKVLKEVVSHSLPNTRPIANEADRAYKGPSVTADQGISSEGYRLEAVVMEKGIASVLVSKWG